MTLIVEIEDIDEQIRQLQDMRDELELQWARRLAHITDHMDRATQLWRVEAKIADFENQRMNNDLNEHGYKAFAELLEALGALRIELMMGSGQ